jgi:hypothetical protein
MGNFHRKLCKEEIKLTEKLYYCPDKKLFFHTGLNSEGEVKICGVVGSGFMCWSCKYHMPKKEKFIIKLGRF